MAGRRAMCSLQSLRRSEGVTFLGKPGRCPKRETRCRASGDRKSHSECRSNNNNSVLFFGSYWPDPKASGAGVRTASLLTAFIERWGYSRAAYASPARDNQAAERLRNQGIQTVPCLMNRESNLASILKESEPGVVVFDRFTAEEAYSWVVSSVAPHALRVLDMQDSHALRLWREQCIQKGGTTLPEILSSVPNASWPLLQRELASILRSDLTLVCSNAEMSLLQNYGVPRDKLCIAPFFYPDPVSAAATAVSAYDDRETGFVTIGTFLHNPNVDGIRWLAKEVWPLIRKESDKFEMRIYGAHLDRAPGDVKQLHNPNQGFHVLGFADSVDEVLKKSKVLLAPLRFGAGLKTKIVDAWSVGTPIVTTPIGSEGMHVAKSPGSLTYTAFDWGGFGRATSAEEFAQDAISLHEDRQLWNSASRRGLEMVSEGFSADRNLQAIHRALLEKQNNLQEVRERDFIGQTLWHNNLRATEFFSRWVEMKEKASK